MTERELKKIGKSTIGVVDYDTEQSDLSTTECTILAPPTTTLKRGVFVKIGWEQSYFIAQIVDGPYYRTVRGVSAGEAKYVADLLAYIDRDIPKAVLSRPIPGTVVEPVEKAEVHRFLGISGGIRLGCLATNRNVEVMMDPATLSRHVGAFGTTGSGKSNTIQVLMEEASNQGFAIIVFDVEGEYIEMDKPTGELKELLADYGFKPAGKKNLKVYVPYPSSCKREDAVRFGIKFTDLERDVFAEVAGLNRMEYLYFEDLIEKVVAVNPSSKRLTLDDIIGRLMNRLKAQADNPRMPPFIAEAHTTLYGKLELAKKLNLIDVKAPSINMEDIYEKGRISVIDFSDTSDYIRNNVIAEILDKAFKYKIKHPETPKIFIVIEEAHAFISKEKKDRMLATLMLVIETARRGRKRGVCLGIVTQQPTHLPTELLELCNTRIMHRMSSMANINALKESTGNVPEGFWKTIPSLGRGEAIVSTPKYTSALSIAVRPTASKRITAE